MTISKKTRARSVADVAAGTILATVDIAAPPARVFRSLASSEVASWWGEEGLYRTTEWTGDVRPGGAWKATGVGSDGKPFSVGGEFVEVTPDRLLSFTWKPDWSEGRPTRVTYRLDPIEGGTRLTLRHEGFDDHDSCSGHAAGWVRVLGWLLDHLEPAAPASPRSYFAIRLLPPRPSFPFDMSEHEKKVMGEHAAYWSQLLADGVAVGFGPVNDPKGVWGLGLLEVESVEAVKAVEAGDPAIRGEIGMRYEVLPMLTAVVRPHG